MGLLLTSVIMKPGFIALMIVFIISGIISSLIMVFYSTRILQIYTMGEIRFKLAEFTVYIQMAQGISQPIAGRFTNVFGPIHTLRLLGLCFLGLSPFTATELPEQTGSLENQI